METNSNEGKLCTTIAEALGVSPTLINTEVSRDDISVWDSVGHITVVMAVEKEFNVRFKNSEIEGLKSVRAFMEKIGSL